MVTTDSRLAAVPEARDDMLYASWTSRVIAAVIDGLALSGLGFLVAGPASSVDIIPPVTFDVGISLDGAARGAQLVFFGACLLVAMLQAYGGATLGKRTVGIAVVDDQTGRPVGLVRTLLRSLAHLLDAILLIGYLRPLWQAERRTFADSIMGTVVLRTRTVRPNLALDALVSRGGRTPAGRPGARGTLGEPATPAWESRTTGTAAVVAVGLALFSGTWSSAVAGGLTSARCSLPVYDSGAFAPSDIRLTADDSTRTERRAWIEHTTAEPADVVVARWSWHGTAPAGTEVELVATSADGTVDARVVEKVPPVADYGTLGALTVDVSSLGPGWTADTSMRVDGVPVASCSLADPTD